MAVIRPNVSRNGCRLLSEPTFTFTACFLSCGTGEWNNNDMLKVEVKGKELCTQHDKTIQVSVRTSTGPN